MSQEFSTLCDLVLARGFQHSELLNRIKTAVLVEYSKVYPEKTADLEVIVDEQNGKVRLYRAGKDATPKDFIQKAEEIARQVLVDLLWRSEQSMESLQQAPVKENKFSQFLAQAMFWGYNLSYSFLVVIMLIGFFNSVSGMRIGEIIEEIGHFKLLMGLILSLIPFVTIAYVIWSRLWHEPKALIKMFFTLEIPLILMTWIPFSMFKEPILPLVFFIIVLILSPILVQISRQHAEKINHRAKQVLFVFQQFILQSWLYLLILFIFFAPLILGSYASLVFNPIADLLNPPRYYDNYYGSGLRSSGPLPWSILFAFLIGSLGALGFAAVAGLVALPFLFSFEIGKLWYKSRQVLLGSVSRERLLGLHLGTLSVWVLVLLAVSYQPSNSHLVEKLVSFQHVSTFDERKELARDLSKQELVLKQTLKDMSNARERYLFTRDDTLLAKAYRDVFHLSSESVFAESIQQSFLLFASPFVYRGEQRLASDAQTAFESFFGHTIYETEHRNEQVKNVHLVSRDITGKTSSDAMLATISIDEEYQSKTWGQQEVVYEFSLPNEAVVTELKLGPDLEYDGVVAPRGAAQRTFEQQKVQRRDPALLEQTGPRQYRLRVFPVPGKDDKTTLKGRNQRVKFSYVVALSEEGFALPVYSREQNIEENLQTRSRVVFDNKVITLSQNERYIRSSQTLNLCKAASPAQLSFSVGQSGYSLVPYAAISGVASQLPCSLNSGSQLIPVSQANIAVLYDVSYTNKDDAALSDLQQMVKNNPQFFNANKVDWYEYSDQLSKGVQITSENDIDTHDVVYFGKSKPLSALKNLSDRYDLVLLLTSDKDSFSLPEADYQTIKMPVAIVHTQEIPAYRNEFTATLLQQGGGVFKTAREALINFALQRKLMPSSSERYLSFNSYWVLVAKNAQNNNGFEQLISSEVMPPVPVNDTGTWDEPLSGNTNPLLYLGYSQYLRYKLRQYQGNLSQNVAFLDAANRFATAAHIVSPYSSMIALVNQQQMDDLRRNSNDARRFDEESNSVGRIQNPIISIERPNSGISRNFGSGGILSPMMGSESFNSFSIPAADSSKIGLSAPAAGVTSTGYLISAGGNLLLLFILFNVILVGGAGAVMVLRKVVRRRK